MSYLNQYYLKCALILSTVILKKGRMLLFLQHYKNSNDHQSIRKH